MTGALKAKVGGVWVPVGTDGPVGALGPPGPPGPPLIVPKTKGRAFTANMWNGGTALGPYVVILKPQNIYLNDGFSYDGVNGLRLLADGRFRIEQNITLTGGTAGNWATFGLQIWRSPNQSALYTFETVGANNTTAYRQYSVGATVDLVAGDGIRSTINVDIATVRPQADNRSWLTIAEVAW